VFVGEAPGENEDKQGIPFCGRSGDLLTDIIVKGMKMRREDVYICNVIKCRPPNNRDPLSAEKDACEPYLIRQLELVQPKVICALGGHAAKTLLKTDESTGRLRGKWHFYHGIPLRVTYHPAYLLRSPGEKKKTWEDIQEVMKVMSGELTPTP
jgi:DNA polymerase